ncbi:PKD domain-containing protein [Nocardia uniformis]|uniref:PKD domain-containing protein n=1 Tax=Nocardia uniformis TaxID=53432 RepID=A0A849C3N7_9NOCA|nr:PKD domain-containing protein [Nocardia uniformis]NNH73304.1 PKD domain-containing protein [Nocardia uniformis]
MKSSRSRWWRPILPLAVPILAVAVGSAPAMGDVIMDSPQVIDVSTTPGSLCDGPLRGTAAVYFPPGVPLQADIEWRILSGDRSLRSGVAAMTGEVLTIPFEIDRHELPADGALRVDARAVIPGGTFTDRSQPWPVHPVRDCAPLHVVSVGDSVIWGQVLDLERKFAHLTAEVLGASTGRAVELHDYSISGAVLDAPTLPVGNDDGSCLTQHYPQDVYGSTTVEVVEIVDRMPDVFCQLEKAATEATAGGYRIDLVLVNGCVNDLDPFFGIPIGVTPGSADLVSAVRRECGGEGANPVNPAANVPFFSGAKLGYGGRGMRSAIEQAHTLPGAPKVLVSNYFHGFDAEGLPDGLRRWSEFVRLSADVFRQAAADANAAAGETYAVAADGLFAQNSGLIDGARKLWMNPFGDEAISLRALACPEQNALPPQCRAAAISQADADGARQYADAFLLNPLIREWFGGGGPAGQGFTVSHEAGQVGLTVHFDASAAGGAVRQYDWYFGDGIHVTTHAPTVSHTYTGRGPNLARLVVTDVQGNRSMYEAGSPIMIG